MEYLAQVLDQYIQKNRSNKTQKIYSSVVKYFFKLYKLKSRDKRENRTIYLGLYGIIIFIFLYYHLTCVCTTNYWFTNSVSYLTEELSSLPAPLELKENLPVWEPFSSFDNPDAKYKITFETTNEEKVTLELSTLPSYYYSVNEIIFQNAIRKHNKTSYKSIYSKIFEATYSSVLFLSISKSLSNYF